MQTQLITPLPDDGDSEFQHLLQNAGYAVTPNPKGQYFNGMLHLAGGLETLDFLRETYMLRLFLNAQLRKGTAYTFRQLKAIALPREQMERFTIHLGELVQKKIFLRGYRLKCPVCDLDSWYEFSSIAEQQPCQGCYSIFQLPLQMDFAYRLNRLFMEGLKQGASTVLLALHFLHRHTEHRLTWQPSYQISKNELMRDIDIIARKDGQLILMECKDSFKKDTASLGELSLQLTQTIAAARDVNADRFYFATLESAIPASIRELLQNAHARILTRADLLNPE